MNTKVVWYLVRTDVSRLWVAVGLLWIVIAAAALPFGMNDLRDLSSAGEVRGITLDGFLASQMTGSRVWAGVLMAVGSMVGGVVPAVCALIGMSGGTWSGARPVRRRERVAAKVVETVVLVGMPLVGASGWILAVHGLPVWEGVRDASVHLMLPLSAMVLAGALCVTFGRWLLWAVGLVLFLVVFGMLAQQGRVAGSVVDVWGVRGDQWVRDAVLCAGFSGLILWKGRFRRSFKVAAAGWPVVVVAMLAGKAGFRGGDEFAGLPRQGLLEGVPLPDELGQVRMVEGGGEAGDPLLVGAGSAGWRTPEGDFLHWRPTMNVVVKREGEVKNGAVSWRGWGLDWKKEKPSSGHRRWDSPMSPEADDEALMGALEGKVGNLVSLRPPGPEESSPVAVYGPVVAGKSGQELFRKGVDLETWVDGFSFRYEKIAELPVGGEVYGEEAGVRFRVSSSFSGGARVVVSTISTVRRAVDFSAEQLAAVLVIPGSGTGFRLEAETAGTDVRFLAGPRFSGIRYQMDEGTVLRVSRLFGSKELQNAKVMVFAKRVTGRTQRRIEARDVRLERDGNEAGRVKVPVEHDGDLGSFFRSYVQSRPVPEVCSEQEAGRWMYRVLSLSGMEEAWVIRELAPFVNRFPMMVLRLPGEVLVRQEVRAMMIEGFPIERRGDLREAMRGAEDDRFFAAWFEIAVQRGWMEEVKPLAMERAGGVERLSSELAEVAVACREPGLYPKILDYVERGAEWGVYLRIRELPDISDALDEAVKGYERSLPRHVRKKVRPWMVPASRGSRPALKVMLEVLSEKAMTGNRFDEWNEVEAVVRLRAGGPDRDDRTVDFRFGNLRPGDFEWSGYLQQWLPVEPSP